MATQRLKYDITQDDLSAFKDKGPAFVTFDEMMVHATSPAYRIIHTAGCFEMLPANGE